MKVMDAEDREDDYRAQVGPGCSLWWCLRCYRGWCPWRSTTWLGCSESVWVLYTWSLSRTRMGVATFLLGRWIEGWFVYVWLFACAMVLEMLFVYALMGLPAEEGAHRHCRQPCVNPGCGVLQVARLQAEVSSAVTRLQSQGDTREAVGALTP